MKIHFKTYHQPIFKKAVFLDRDGVINKDTGYIKNMDTFVFQNKVSEAIQLINQKGYSIIIVTNQSGVAREYFSLETMWQINDYMVDRLKKDNALIDAVYCSPYLPPNETDLKNEFVVQTNCRKPGNGMIEDAIKRYNFNRTNSILLGDSNRDIEAGKASQLGRCILIKDVVKESVSDVLVSENLYSAVEQFIP